MHGQSKLAQKSRINDFSRENDFQLMLPEFHDLDVNDPRNDSLLVTKAKRAMLNDDRDYFYLKGLDFSVVFGMGEHGFTNFVKFCQPSRMKLLRLRIAKPFLFSGPIPLSEDVIRQSEIYKKLLGKDAIDVGLEDEDDLDTALGGTGKESVNLMKVTSYLQRVRNSHTANNRKAKKKKLVTSSVVIETDYLALGTIKVPSIFERRRSLHPFKQIRAPVAMQVDKCEILLQIVGAKNIPLRKEYKKLNPSTRTKLSARMQQLENQNRAQVRELSLDVEAGGFGEFPSTSANEGSSRRPIVSEHILDERKINEKRRARTFVEVRFQERRVATSSYEGATPLWKESISLPFRPPDNDFSPSVLEQMREDVYLTLFDEIIEDDADRGGRLYEINLLSIDQQPFFSKIYFY